MTWSYSGDPSSSNTDAVRFYVGDTDTTDQLVQNEEIDYILTVEGSVQSAASEVARAIGAKLARQADKAVGDLKISRSQRSKAYYELSDRLAKEASLTIGTPFAGGISKSDKLNREEDTDRTDPSIRRAIHDVRTGVYDQDNYDYYDNCRR